MRSQLYSCQYRPEDGHISRQGVKPPLKVNTVTNNPDFSCTASYLTLSLYVYTRPTSFKLQMCLGSAASLISRHSVISACPVGEYRTLHLRTIHTHRPRVKEQQTLYSWIIRLHRPWTQLFATFVPVRKRTTQIAGSDNLWVAIPSHKPEW